MEIAYQELGNGPIDLLQFTGAVIPIECMDEEPSMARFQRRLASFSRLLRFDRRGMGLSDRGWPSTFPTHEQWVDDGIAVLDAVGSVKAAVLAPFTQSPTGLMLAALHPERVSALVVVNGAARAMWAPDYPMGIPKSQVEMIKRLFPEPDAVVQGYDLLAINAPSVADDSAFRSWWDRSGNLGSTPAMARASALFDTDVREFLPLIRVPTLIIQRADSPILNVGNGASSSDQRNDTRTVAVEG